MSIIGSIFPPVDHLGTFEFQETPEEIKVFLAEEDKIWGMQMRTPETDTIFFKILERKDISDLIDLALKYYNLSFTNPDLKVMALNHFNRIMDEIYLQINRLKKKEEKIEISIKFIEFILKNKTPDNIRKLIEKLNLIISTNLAAYPIQNQNFTLKILFDISIKYLNFTHAEYYLRKMIPGGESPTLLNRSIVLSGLLNDNGMYDKAIEILHIAKKALNISLRQDKHVFRGKIKKLNQSILSNKTAYEAYLRQQVQIPIYYRDREGDGVVYVLA
jgi:hypothetical protein